MNIRQVSAIWLGIATIGALLLYPPHVMIPSAVEMAQLEFGAPGNPHPVQLVRYAFGSGLVSAVSVMFVQK